MCGIAGFWTRAAIDAGRAARLAGAMATALAHRGPDGHGVWTDPSGIALAHRRLAVVELSEAGAQPMHSHSGRWTVTYNGEIYNHGALRERLVAEQGWPMRGRSDTEVLVEALDRWGVATTLERIDGMFAFAAWDRDQQALVLAIDRFGEKPLYYGWSGGDTLLFGSEPAALDRHPAFAPALCREAVVDLMQFGYVPAPRTLFEGVWKCPPGSAVTFTAADLRAAQLPPPFPYWQALAVAAEGAAEGAARSEGLSEAQWVDRLSDVLARSVGRQLQADVPVGAFLSGGIDSTTIVAVAQSISARPLHTAPPGDSGMKVALRRLLDRHVPRSLVERPKTGFGIPIDDWLRGPLREWASDLLAPARVKREGVLDPGLVNDCWQRHLSGRQNLQQHLWPILMFQQWCDSRK